LKSSAAFALAFINPSHFFTEKCGYLGMTSFIELLVVLLSSFVNLMLGLKYFITIIRQAAPQLNSSLYM
jgi:hypothetical protein